MGIEVLAAASIGTSIAGTVVGAMGANATADANAGAARYQAQIARNNAQIAEQNAVYARLAGEQQATTQSFKTAQLLGRQKAQQGASGIDVNSGSPLDVRMSTAEMGELDVLTILNNAEKQALGYKNQGTNFMAEAELYDMKAHNARLAGDYAVASTIIGGASSVSGKWAGFKQSGMFG